jgi:glycosyltransferase involved in cell wall biosynthesis
MEIEATVIICTRDQRESLLETLDSLEAQACGFGWEVLIVDNGCTDGTAEAIEARAEKFPAPLRRVCEARQGLSFARNLGAREARGGILLYNDDDVSCEPGWLDAHRRAFADPSVWGTGGPILPVLPVSTPEWIRENVRKHLGGPTAHYDFGPQPAEIEAGSAILLPFGANMGVRRERVIALGGFRTDLGWGARMLPGEDTEFLGRLRDAGGRLRYCPQGRVLHRIKEARVQPETYLRWYRGYGRSVALMAQPESRLRTLRSIGRELIRLAYQLAIGLFRSPHEPRGYESRCKLERSLGRLTERIRLLSS